MSEASTRFACIVRTLDRDASGVKCTHDRAESILIVGDLTLADRHFTLDRFRLFQGQEHVEASGVVIEAVKVRFEHR
jgi:hypothetical protein